MTIFGEWDGVTLGGFFSADFEQFADERMASGDNLLWRIGHDVFRVRDLEASWPESALRRPDTPYLTASVAAATLVYPDRVAWFLLNQSGRNAATE